MIKPIVNYENRYLVTSEGEIVSIIFNRKILKPKVNKYGYLVVNLTDGLGNTKSKCVHRLVAEAFCDKDTANNTVNHKDLNKTNNAYENLEWCSAKYNFEHAANNNIVRSKVGILRYPKALSEKILSMRAAGASIYKIANTLSISKSTVHRRIKDVNG